MATYNGTNKYSSVKPRVSGVKEIGVVLGVLSYHSISVFLYLIAGVKEIGVLLGVLSYHSICVLLYLIAGVTEIGVLLV